MLDVSGSGAQVVSGRDQDSYWVGISIGSGLDRDRDRNWIGSGLECYRVGSGCYRVGIGIGRDRDRDQE